MSKNDLLQQIRYFSQMSIKMDLSRLSSQPWLKLTEQFYLDTEGKLGEGCFGEVFRGYSTKLDKFVAIKTMDAKAEGYERQIETLKVLSSLVHPNIMGYHGFEKVNDAIYIFIEFCPNGTLTDKIKEKIPEQIVLKYFRQMVEGMCYMNAKAKMHRDLKPDNILMGPQNDVKISDFGLARETNSIFVTGQMGTPLYAGPQVYLFDSEENYSQKCDVWGAGMILYEMLTGERLFQKTFEDLKNQWIMYEKGERRVSYSKQLHPHWQYFTNIMLTFDAKKRPTFHEVLQKLKKVYDKMKEQITNKKVESLNQNTKIGRLQIFLNFILQKYQILIQITDSFTQKDINIRNQFKFFIMFLCLSHYLCHTKKLIRNLKYKRIKVNEDDDEEMIEEDDQNFDMLLDKFRNLFDHKYNFFNDQIRKNIIPKIIDYYGKKEESTQIIKQAIEITELANDVRDGTFDVEETYEESLRNLMLKKIEIVHKGLINKLNLEECRIYHKVLVGALLNQKFPNQKYLTKNLIKDYFQKVNSKDLQSLKLDILKLKEELK